jgi:hypothetical protein
VRLRGPWLVGQLNLNTAVSSASGTILAGTGLNVLLTSYAFWPAMETPLNIDLRFIWPIWFVSPPAPDADEPLVSIVNFGAVDREWAIAWRHIEP